MDSLACDYLSQYNTAAVLIEACHLDKTSSVFAKDQVCYSIFHFPHKGTNGLKNEGKLQIFYFALIQEIRSISKIKPTEIYFHLSIL